VRVIALEAGKAMGNETAESREEADFPRAWRGSGEELRWQNGVGRRLLRGEKASTLRRETAWKRLVGKRGFYFGILKIPKY
jgi:hypothetical protein